MVIAEAAFPAVAPLMIAARHFLAPAFSLAGLFAFALLAAMTLALHCLGLTLLALGLLLLLLVLLAGT
jgi:hypothetical protein